MDERPVVVYDDGCPACTVGKKLSERLDAKKNLDFVGMNTERGKGLVQTHDLNMHASAYLIEGAVVSDKAKMMRDVLAHNGPIGFLMSLPFRIPWFGDRLYELIALHRSHEFRE